MPALQKACQRDTRTTGALPALTEVTGSVIRHTKSEQQKEPKNCGDDHYLGQLFTGVFYMHEKENNQQSFDGSDDQRDYGIEAAQVDERNSCGNYG
jgi:hypothetical protein